MHHFDFEYRDILRSPWYSGLAQGQGISVLARAFKETSLEKYKNAAHQAFQVFSVSTYDGGVNYIDSNGHSWIEEYIVHPPTHILNGFIWGLWGIYDYWLLTKDKNVKVLFEKYKIIKALNKLKEKFNISLSLVGSFDERNKKILEEKIHSLNIQKSVKILGKVNYKKLPHLYNQHDIKIYASKSETFGMTMLEAMKCGLPILATKNQISYEKNYFNRSNCWHCWACDWLQSSKRQECWLCNDFWKDYKSRTSK